MSLGSTLLVTAEVNSTEGAFDGRIEIATVKSLQQANKKSKVELRQEYAEHAERRRELEFLEKGGTPLDLKYCDAASIILQSTQPAPEEFVRSEAKDSFALTAPPQGILSKVVEWHCVDNPLLFDGESEFLEGDVTSVLPTGNRIVALEQFSQLDGNQNVKESGDSNAFVLQKS